MTRPPGARWSSPSMISACQARSVTSSRAPSRLDTVSSGPMTRNDAGLRTTTSFSQSAITPLAPARLPSGRGTSSGVVAEVGQVERGGVAAPVGLGRGAHPPLARRRQPGHRVEDAARLVEQLLGLVAAHPRLEHLQVLVVVAHAGQRHLVRAPGALDLLAVDHARAGPPLGGAQHEHRPRRAARVAAGAGGVLVLGDGVEHRVERVGQLAVDVGRVVARHDERRVAVAREQRDAARSPGCGTARSGWRSCSR